MYKTPFRKFDHTHTHIYIYVIEFAKRGAIVYYANSCRPSGGNLSSTKGQLQVVDEYLLVECCEGRVLGPLDPSGFPHVHTSYSQLVLSLSSWISRKSSKRKELKSIVGHLAHASCVVKPSKTFTGHLFGLLLVARKPHHHVRLNQESWSDMLWRATFVSS